MKCVVKHLRACLIIATILIIIQTLARFCNSTARAVATVSVDLLQLRALLRKCVAHFFEKFCSAVRKYQIKQDGATCLTARVTIDLLRGEFDEYFISRSGPLTLGGPCEPHTLRTPNYGPRLNCALAALPLLQLIVTYCIHCNWICVSTIVISKVRYVHLRIRSSK